MIRKLIVSAAVAAFGSSAFAAGHGGGGGGHGGGGGGHAGGGHAGGVSHASAGHVGGVSHAGVAHSAAAYSGVGVTRSALPSYSSAYRPGTSYPGGGYYNNGSRGGVVLGIGLGVGGLGGYGGGYGLGGYGGGYGGRYYGGYGYSTPYYYPAGSYGTSGIVSSQTLPYSYATPAPQIVDPQIVDPSQPQQTEIMPPPAGPAPQTGPFKYDGDPANPVPLPAPEKPADKPAEEPKDAKNIKISLPAKPVFQYPAYGQK